MKTKRSAKKGTAPVVVNKSDETAKTVEFEVVNNEAETADEPIVDEPEVVQEPIVKAPEQSAEEKAVFTKLLNGETLTAKEAETLSAYSRRVNTAKSKGQAEADAKSKLVEERKVWERKMQEHRLAVQQSADRFFESSLNPKVIATITGKVLLKKMFADFLQTLPDAPAEPTLKKTRKTGTGTSAWNKQVDVNKMREGSTLHVLWTKLMEAGDAGLTREEMEKVMFTAFPKRTTDQNKFSAYEAISGRLPLRNEKDRYYANPPVEEPEVVEEPTANK